MTDVTEKMAMAPSHWRDEGKASAGVHQHRPLLFSRYSAAAEYAERQKEHWGRGWRVRCEEKYVMQDGAQVWVWVVTVRDVRKSTRDAGKRR